MSTTALKGWFGPLLFMAAMVGAGMILMWPLTAPPPATDTSIAIIAICRDGTPIYRRPDGSHYARKGFDRYDVPNPETVCR